MKNSISRNTLPTLIPILCWIILFFMGTACTSKTDFQVETGYQAISALGDTLYAPKIDPETESRFETNLKEARSRYIADPDNAEAIIWYGRRTAYLGNYRKAIKVFTSGIKKHPRDARMFRHQGHRYITIRKFEKAISDLEHAAELIEGTEDTIEPDGLPNRQNKPRSTLHTNIWYHLGLAYYLVGDFESAIHSYRNCLNASTNDDMLVATTYWLYMSVKRAGTDEPAGELLEPIHEEMNIIENESYLKLLLVFKGEFNEKSLLDDPGSSLDNATIGYGIGNWHYINGRKERAKNIFKDVYAGDSWTAFGYIAAETDLARLW